MQVIFDYRWSSKEKMICRYLFADLLSYCDQPILWEILGLSSSVYQYCWRIHLKSIASCFNNNSDLNQIIDNFHLSDLLDKKQYFYILSFILMCPKDFYYSPISSFLGKTISDNKIFTLVVKCLDRYHTSNYVKGRYFWSTLKTISKIGDSQKFNLLTQKIWYKTSDMTILANISAQHGHLKLVKNVRIINRRINRDDINLNDVLISAVDGNQFETMIQVLEWGSTDHKRAFVIACNRGYLPIAKYLYDRFGSGYKPYLEGLAPTDHTKLIEFLNQCIK